MGRFDHCFPFAAVAGQDSVKQALLLCAVNPAIGGVLLAGEKGTAKSTLVRGLAALLEDAPFVELPLNVTEDRLVGSVDLEAALQRGQLQSEGGLLQRSDGGFLYVEEVNLLSEHMWLYDTISLEKREIENIYGTLSCLAWVGENNLK